MRSWARSHIPEILWAAFATIEFALLFIVQSWPTVPFHFVWLSLTILYGFRVWGLRATWSVLAVVCVVSTVLFGVLINRGKMHPDELFEVPLMASMFMAMVWHARRRQAALEQVSRAAERERDFVRDASHRLKTPIAVSRGLTQLMLSGGSAQQAQSDLTELDDELRRLSTIAENLLVLATADRPNALFLERVEVEDVIVSAARRWAHAADREWVVDVTGDGLVWADRGRLDAALDALVENAVDATDGGARIELRGRSTGRAATFEVADQGRGIPPDFLPHVFERFASTRHGDATRRGAGLGLPIAQAVAQAHGGTATLQSTLGQGTQVTLRLPAFTPAPAPAGTPPRAAHAVPAQLSL